MLIICGAGVTQVVEYQLPKLAVAGSNPVTRFQVEIALVLFHLMYSLIEIWSYILEYTKIERMKNGVITKLV